MVAGILGGLFFGGRWIYGTFISASSEPASVVMVEKADAAMAEKRFADAATTYERARKTLKSEGGSAADVILGYPDRAIELLQEAAQSASNSTPSTPRPGIIWVAANRS